MHKPPGRCKSAAPDVIPQPAGRHRGEEPPGVCSVDRREVRLTGELAALGTALCWTVTVMAFEAAGRRIGSFHVNYLRLLVGLCFLTLYSTLFRGLPLPTDASQHVWLWMSLSGIVGFVIGDLCLFRAFVLIGSRVTMVIFALVPPMSALVSWAFLGEELSVRVWLAMAVTVAGICMVVLVRDGGRGRMRLSPPLGGMLLALAGAGGQALGFVLSKHGMGDYDRFAATQIRIIAASASFLLLIPLMGEGRRMLAAVRDRRAVWTLTLGAFFGPFLGVSLSLVAIGGTEVGVATTIMAMVPVFIILPEVLLLGRSVRPAEVLGALVAVGGIALLSL